MAKKVEIICIMDRSGSMEPIMAETVGAFNAFVQQQQELPGKARLTLIAFDHEYTVVLDRVKLKQVPELTVADLPPRGMTALNDAVGRAVRSMETDAVVCLIQTDGHENASTEYSTDQVKALLDEKKKDGWEISFIGAGIDAFAVGGSFGLKLDECLSVERTEAGVKEFGERISEVSTAFRQKHSGAIKEAEKKLSLKKS